jgi:hypothetical protein
MPVLLRQQQGATFITINERDFWHDVLITKHFCVLCFALPTKDVEELPELLRAVLRCPPFHTKAERMGKVARVTRDTISYYTYQDPTINTLSFA